MLRGALSEPLVRCGGDRPPCCGGPPNCTARLTAETYEALTCMARRRVRRYAPQHSVDPCAVVHETYLRLASQNRCWIDRDHFMAAAARIMKFILIEESRRKAAIKNGGRLRAHDLDKTEACLLDSPDERIDLGEALDRLARGRPHQASVIALRFFADFSVNETAKRLGISEGTVRRHWYEARAWLAKSLLAG